MQGWGVEIGLLIDLAERYGSEIFAQADLGVREHRNRPLDQLSPQAMAVLLTALRRAGIPDARLSHTLVHYGIDKQPATVDVETRERPAMLTVPSYRAKFGRELTA